MCDSNIDLVWKNSHYIYSKRAILTVFLINTTYILLLLFYEFYNNTSLCGNGSGIDISTQNCVLISRSHITVILKYVVTFVSREKKIMLQTLFSFRNGTI